MTSCMVAASHVMMMGIMSEMDEEDACLMVDRGKPRKNVFATDEEIHDTSRGHTSSNGNMRSFATRKNSIKIPAELLKNLKIEQRIQISSTTSKNRPSFGSTVQMPTHTHDDCMIREDSSTQSMFAFSPDLISF